MQTFLPYAGFRSSAHVLDRARLGKQRVECLQILRCLAGVTDGWRNHPAVKMWRGHESHLVKYSQEVCREWISRGYRDTCLFKIGQLQLPDTRQTPDWLGNPEFHASHRSNLLRKDPDWYGQYGWIEPHDLPYVWPIGEFR